MSDNVNALHDPDAPSPATGLLPCPFCGAWAKVERDVEHDGLWARCQWCRAGVGPVYEDSPCADEDTKSPREMLLSAWNRRVVDAAAPPEGPTLAAVLAELRKVIPEDVVREALEDAVRVSRNKEENG